MQIMVNISKANKVISTAPAINTYTIAFKRKSVRVEAFDYGTPMGWGSDIRVRVFLDGVALPFGSECLHKRTTWLPRTATIKEWNSALQLIV